MYTMEELRQKANELIMGNTTVCNLNEIKEVFMRNNMMVVEFGEHFLVFEVVEH